MRIIQKQIKNPNYRPVTGIFDPTTAEPAAPNFGDEFIASATGAGNVTAFAFTAENIYRWDGATWVEEVPVEGMAVDNATDDNFYRFSGAVWEMKQTPVLVKEVLAVTAQNAITDLTNAPADGNDVTYFVNGVTVDVLAGSGITLAGQTATVVPATLGYNIETTDRVVASYEALI